MWFTSNHTSNALLASMLLFMWYTLLYFFLYAVVCIVCFILSSFSCLIFFVRLYFDTCFLVKINVYLLDATIVHIILLIYFISASVFWIFTPYLHCFTPISTGLIIIYIFYCIYFSLCMFLIISNNFFCTFHIFSAFHVSSSLMLSKSFFRLI